MDQALSDTLVRESLDLEVLVLGDLCVPDLEDGLVGVIRDAVLAADRYDPHTPKPCRDMHGPDKACGVIHDTSGLDILLRVGPEPEIEVRVTVTVVTPEPVTPHDTGLQGVLVGLAHEVGHTVQKEPVVSGDRPNGRVQGNDNNAIRLLGQIFCGCFTAWAVTDNKCDLAALLAV